MPYAEVCQNLRLYLNQAVLPTMGLGHGCPAVPQSIKTTGNRYLLSPEPDSRRKLKTVLYLVPEVINKRIMSFILKQIPNTPIVGAHHHTPNRYARFSVPAPSFTISYNPPCLIRDIQTMASWMRIALRTADRVMCVVWPEQTTGFCFQSEKLGYRHPDADIYKAFFWAKVRGVDQNDVQESTVKLVVVMLAPWALPPVDMIDFVRAHKFPAFSINQGHAKGPASYTRAHKIWAKIWDDCTRNNCPYFVLSVYHGWVFGVFVKGWTTVLISETIKHTDAKPCPTVLQWLVFWIAASMGLPGAWVAPPLKRFGNADISNNTNVAIKLSNLQVLEEEETVGHADWLEENHKQDEGEETVESSNLENNTWMLSFA